MNPVAEWNLLHLLLLVLVLIGMGVVVWSITRDIEDEAICRSCAYCRSKMSRPKGE